MGTRSDIEDVQGQVYPLLAALYAESGKNIDELCHTFLGLLNEQKARRSEGLQVFDAAIPADWFKTSDTVAYVLYADLFTPEASAGHKLDALREQLDYFIDLGVNVLHILPILKSSGDAGFAVDDYQEVDPQFGTTEALQKLIDACHGRGIRLALDFVLNHVSDAHVWAVAAAKRDAHYVEFFLWSDSGESWPDVPDVFPEFAPGHWDFVESVGKYVWSTFYKRRPKGAAQDQHAFAQWDLNYANPDVLFGMLNYLLHMANWGVDIFRLDAVPHMWKEKGTRCRSGPQIHTILKILRLALQAVAPRAVFLAEANEELAQLMQYFGAGDEVQIAYHFALMPELWRAVTIGNIAGIQQVLTRQPYTNDHAHWWVFSEVHDEVGLDKVDAAIARELSGYFLASGGLPFRQSTQADGPRGISGTTYTLLRGDVRRILLLWQLKLSLGWTPLFYMGEELGVENDLTYQDNSGRARDSRFVKRVALTREKKNRRQEVGSIESYLYDNLKRFIAWRKQHPCLVLAPDFFDVESVSVLGFAKDNAHERLVILANCSDVQQIVTVPEIGTKLLQPFEFWWESRRPVAARA